MAPKAIVAILTIFFLGFLAPAAHAQTNSSSNSTGNDLSYEFLLSIEITFDGSVILTQVQKDAYQTIGQNIEFLRNLTGAVNNATATEVEKLEQLLNNIAAAVQSGAIQLNQTLNDAVTQTLSLLQTQRDEIQAVVDKVKADLATLLVTVQNALTILTNNTVNALNGLVTAAKKNLLGSSLAKSATNLVGLIQSGNLTTQLAKILAQNQDLTLQQVIQQLAKNVSAAAEVVTKSTLLPDLSGQIKGALNGLVATANADITNLVNELSGALKVAASTLLQAVTGVVAVLGNALGGVLGETVQALVVVLGGLVGVLGGLIGTLGTVLAAVVGVVGIVVGGLVGVLGGLLGGLLGVLGGLVGGIGGGLVIG